MHLTATGSNVRLVRCRKYLQFSPQLARAVCLRERWHICPRLGFLARIKESIKAEYDQRLETHKAQLKAESDKEVEKLKAQLQIAASERSIRLSHVFEKQADVIATIYGKLVFLNRAMADYTKIIERTGDPTKEERRAEFDRLSKEFINYFEPHKLYLPKKTAVMVESYYKNLWNLGIDFLHNVEKPIAGDRPKVDEWMKISQKMTEDVPKLLDILTDDFRRLLGMHDETQGSGLNNVDSQITG